MQIHIKELIYYLGLHTGSVVSVVGSGGKTTLITALARELSRRCRVCVAASTKMEDPGEAAEQNAGNIHRILKGSPAMAEPICQPGIYYAADEIAQGHKLHGFSREMVNWAQKNTDVILIEADGSKRLPLKGWADHEPVVVPQTQITIGVIPVYLLGKPVSEENVHRFPLFSQITGAGPGDILTQEHLIRAISHPKGLFGKAVGEKVLFFSQVYDEAMAEAANAIAADPRLDFIDKIVIGYLESVQVAAVIMASGFSRRMDANKLLLEHEGRPVVWRVMDSAAKAGFSRADVVTAYDEIANMAQAMGLAVIRNRQPYLGQSQSVILGAGACRDMDGIMFIPGDMPFLSPSVLKLLMDAFSETPQWIIRPMYGQKPGSPVIFPKRFFPELLELKGDTGGREVIQKHPQWVRTVAVDDVNAGRDIDTPEDARQWLLKRGERIED